ncbi:MAG TPA: hypothetical protein VIC57_14245 [Candidatus Dormibacteraeota bacterium]|jgi:hypothetical protein
MATAQIAAPRIERARFLYAHYDWFVLAACSWLVAGGFLDGWAHGHFGQLDPFFTPWHGILYSGYAATAALIVGRFLLDRSVPAAYRLSLIGCGTFAVGGLADMVWHLTFGIERQIANVLSPSHLLLIVSTGLVVSGPLRAALARPGIRAPFYAVLAGALILCYLTLITEFAQPYLDRLAAIPARARMPYNEAVQIGLFGVILQSAILVILLLRMRERFELPFGTLTVMVGLQGLMLGLQTNLDFMVLVAVLGGLAGDVWLRVLGRRTHVLAFAVPATVYAIYVLSLLLVYGTWWEVHAVTGIVVVAGLTGWAISMLTNRPQAQPAAA